MLEMKYFANNDGLSAMFFKQNVFNNILPLMQTAKIFSFTWNGKSDLSLLDMLKAWKQQLNYKNNLFTIHKELM